jgi:DNA-binding beta-propeller fold protein YncE
MSFVSVMKETLMRPIARRAGTHPRRSSMKGKGRIVLAGCLSLLSVFVMTASVSFADTYDFLTQWYSGYEPKGIAVDSTGGYVYVADTNNQRILKTTTSGSPVTSWGSYGSGNGYFNYPRGVALDSSSNVYVADTNNHRIQKFQSAGAFSSAFGSYGTGDGQFNKPAGVFVDSSGTIYVADTGNNRIQIFNSDGTFSSAFGSFGTTDGKFNSPTGVAVDSGGYIYVADMSNHRIQKFTASGTFSLAWGSYGTGNGQFNLPVGINVDSADMIYVADTDNHRIQKFTEDGVFITTWGSYGIANGLFDEPNALAIDTVDGNVFVADTNNNRVQVFEPEPEITLTTPNGGDSWGAGSQVTVSWTYVGYPGAYVRLELLKGGVFNRTIVASTSIGGGGTGSYIWTVPTSQLAGSDYRVKVTSTSDSTYYDISDTDFSIVAPSISVVTPNGGEVWSAGTQYTLEWSYTGSPGSSVKIELLKGGAVNRTITGSTTIGSGGSGTYLWTIPSAQITDADYAIRVTSISNSTYYDTSDGPFTINAPSITMGSPNGGEVYGAGEVVTISWTFQGNPGAGVNIDLYKGGIFYKKLVSRTTVGSGGTGSYRWTIPLTQASGTDYRIKVTSATNSSYADMSDGDFTITPPTITVGSPNGGEVLGAGVKIPISWTYTGNPGAAVKIELYKGGVFNRSIVSSASKGTNFIGLYNWTIPATQEAGSDYRVRITSKTDGTVYDESDADFSITAPTITVTGPNGGESYNVGEQIMVSWNYTGSPGTTVKVELYKGGVAVKTMAASYPIASGGSCVWTIPAGQTPGSDYRVKVTSTRYSAFSDMSDGDFTILPPTVNVTTPNGGESWTVGTTVPIKWSYTGNPGSRVQIDLHKGGTFDRTITSGTSKGGAGNGTFNWKIPTTVTPGTDYRVTITSTTYSTCTDTSDADFSIF